MTPEQPQSVGPADQAPPFPKTQQAQPKGPVEDAFTPKDLDALRQLRVLEERFVNLRRKSQLTDDNVHATETKLRDDIRRLTQELVDMRRQVADMEERLATISGEMQHAASIYDVKALERYLSYWEPMNFITREELMRTRNLLKQQGGSSR